VSPKKIDDFFAEEYVPVVRSLTEEDDDDDDFDLPSDQAPRWGKVE
jgi:hypothetical protein